MDDDEDDTQHTRSVQAVYAYSSKGEKTFKHRYEELRGRRRIDVREEASTKKKGDDTTMA